MNDINIKAKYKSNSNNLDRNYYIDNLKFCLIVLVVVGHFAIKLTSFGPVKSLQYFIYLFHMPCFIFVSGYLAKGINAGGKLRADKILVTVWLYFIFKAVNSLIEYAFTGKLDFNILKDTSAPWYLVTLTIWYISVPLIERIKAVYLLPASIFTGLMVGYCNHIHNVLSLSRVFVFFPFFIMGFCLSEDKLNSFLNKRIRFIAIIYLTALFIFFLIYRKEINPVSDIIYATSPYSDSLENLAPYGFLIRFIWYILAFITSAAFMLLVPRRPMFFTSLGSRTLQVYMSHIWCRNILVYLGFFEFIKGSSLPIAALVLLGSIGLTFILSNSLFYKMFDLISARRLIKKMLK